jgi:hypothetical protein
MNSGLLTTDNRLKKRGNNEGGRGMCISFPSLYPNELFYSACARYYSRSLANSQKTVMNELFNNPECCAVVDLPTHLREFVAQLPPGTTNEKVIVFNHTLYPYYGPFLPKERAEQIYASLLSSVGGGNPHFKIGIVASGVLMPFYLRYCVDCINDDETDYGEPYWHRVHQLPGVLICPKHGQVLSTSDVLFSSIRGKHKFVLLQDAVEQQTMRPDIRIEKHFKLLKEIADYSQLLIENELHPIGLESIRSLYMSRLLSMGLVTANGRVRFAELFPRFVSFFGHELLDLLGEKLNIDDEDTWLHKVFRKPKVTCHPMRHILIMLFLDMDISSIENHQGYKPFGKGPWPCLNRAADHYRQTVINECNISRCSKTSRPVGTFKCDCGFVYSRRGPDQSTDDLFKIGRIKEFGPVWGRKCDELSKQDDKSLRAKARELGVDPMTIKKHLQNKENQKTTTQKVIPLDKYTRRKRMLRSMQKLTIFSRTAMKENNMADYICLYRHDKEWLRMISPPSLITDKGHTRVNWKRRDLELREKVQQCLFEFNRTEYQKPIRITLSEIGRRTGEQGILAHCLDKLPQTKTLIEDNLEKIEQFQIRRIRWAAGIIKADEGRVPKWKLKRVAGISEDKCTEEVVNLLISLADD